MKVDDREGQNAQAFIEERILRRIPVEIFGLSLAIALGSLFFFSPLTGLFIVAGGAFSAASFVWLKSSLNRFLGQDRKKAIRSGLIFYLARLALLLSVFLIIILLLPGMVLAFVAGFSTIVLVFFGEAVRSLSQIKTWKS
jgi:dolichol kinase